MNIFEQIFYYICFCEAHNHDIEPVYFWPDIIAGHQHGYAIGGMRKIMFKTDTSKGFRWLQ